MSIFKTDMSLNDMLEKMDNNQGVTETIHAGAVFINYKLQKELLDSQNTFNKKQLFWSRILSLATIALVMATMLLIKFS